MHGPLDPAQIEDRADRMVRHLAIEVDATTEQQEKLRAIVKGAVKDLVPMREKVSAARQRARELLTEPTIDRAAIERLRAEQMALADAVSQAASRRRLPMPARCSALEQRRKLDDCLPPPGVPGPGRGWIR